MDKNFIRVDDLVRQHLEGAEEKERGGAWLKMRDLLDQEMPQKKRVGILYWRRMFGLVAAVSLIGTLAVGSYEFSSAFKRLQNADAVNPNSNAASTESGQIAMEMPSGEPENEPATSGNISVRTNTHAARTAPMTANNTVNNTTDNSLEAEHTTTYNGNVNNTTNNTTNNNNINNNATYSAANSAKNTTAYGSGLNNNNTANNTQKATGHTSIANNKVDDVNIRGKRIVRSGATAENSNDGTNNTARTIAAVNSKAVPDKPVTGDDKGGLKNGKRNNGANKNTTACAVNKTPGTTGKSGKTVAANCTDGKSTNKLAIAGITPADNTSEVTATGTAATGHALAQNDPTAAMTNNTSNKQSIGALNSSGPSIATAKPEGQTARPKELAKAEGGQGVGNGVTAPTTAKTKGTATNYSGSVKATRIKKAGNATTNTTGVAANNTKTGTAAKTNTTAANGNTGTVAARNTPSAKVSGASSKSANKGTAVAGNSRKTGSNASNNAAAGKKAPIAASNAVASQEETYEEEEVSARSAAAKTGKAKTGKTATAKGATAAKNGTTTVKADKATAATQKTATAASNNKEAGTAAATNNGKMGEKQDMAALALNSGGNNETATNKPEDKKTITKMVVREREVKNSDNEVMTAVDTLSMEKMNMGHAAKEEEEPTTASTANKSNNKTSTTSIAEEEPTNNAPVEGNVRAKRKHRHKEEASVTAAEETPAAETEIAPAAAAAPATEEAAATTATAAAAETKTKEKAKHSGASLLKKMSAMFNDVKDHARGARPIAGIAAGINSNFFGPSKMMGFQFGMTGTMEFSETWSLMAELKYFHRVNRNTVTDDYYTYTQVGNQYSKQLVQTSYDFAAAHNVEMPMTIRYAKGNFNFYTGANFLYSFSINTARATMPATTDPTLVSTMGTDNAPKYTEADFGSRFGLGYIFGFSVQVAPNTSLDIRNVQTVWDNASTMGAKSVSNMLYKTPSVQLSVMYRLGGNRNKE